MRTGSTSACPQQPSAPRWPASMLYSPPVSVSQKRTRMRCGMSVPSPYQYAGRVGGHRHRGWFFIHAAESTRFANHLWAGLNGFGVDVFFVLSGFIITQRLSSGFTRTVRLRTDIRAFTSAALSGSFAAGARVSDRALPAGSRDAHAGHQAFADRGLPPFFQNHRYAGHPVASQ